MKSGPSLHILDQTESTNNYAMARVHSGMAVDGEAWFTHHQTHGRGQRGKTWNSLPNENLLMSVVFRVPAGFKPVPFVFNALIANTSRFFLASLANEPVQIKWPNDLYAGSQKIGGILIENNYKGSDWNWAVAGIGVNVNQTNFPDGIGNPVSLAQISKRSFNPVVMAKELHNLLLKAVSDTVNATKIMIDYNENLFARGRLMRLRKNNIVFETTIVSVDEHGHLHCADAIPRTFMFGEIEWLI